ncbi:large ribosomal subunit protein mL55 [Pseudophryne corroboree]|uniref:large ribosomal subunit protein mL55 n=1 Tax=Pseudophryne corroboree TaxID=495146 RepID=UPI003081C02D
MALHAFLRSLQNIAHRSLLPASHPLHTAAELQNSNRACTGRSGRKAYLRTYPVLLVQPDGSTISIQYKEPRRLLTMPLDISTLSEEQRKVRLRLRNRPKKGSATKEKDIYDDSNLDRYSKFWKKK